MDDKEIIEMYHRRDENAITETKTKYERYLMKIAYNILADIQDSEESVNDTYLKSWNSMPPHYPNNLSAFLARITRRTSIDIFRRKHSEKRFNSEYSISLDELAECVADSGDSPQSKAENDELSSAVNRYLGTLSEEHRNIFLMRYFFFDPIKAIASSQGISEAKVKTVLHRTRNGLKIYLEREDII